MISRELSPTRSGAGGPLAGKEMREVVWSTAPRSRALVPGSLGFCLGPEVDAILNRKLVRARATADVVGMAAAGSDPGHGVGTRLGRRTCAKGYRRGPGTPGGAGSHVARLVLGDTAVAAGLPGLADPLGLSGPAEAQQESEEKETAAHGDLAEGRLEHAGRDRAPQGVSVGWRSGEWSVTYGRRASALALLHPNACTYRL